MAKKKVTIQSGKTVFLFNSDEVDGIETKVFTIFMKDGTAQTIEDGKTIKTTKRKKKWF